MRNRQKANEPNEGATNARKAMFKRGKKNTGDPNMPYYLVVGGFAVLMVVIVLYMVLNPKESILNKKVIDHNEFLVQNLQNEMWKAGPNEQFVNYTMNEAQKFFNIAISDSPNMPQCPKHEDIEIPDSYDFREDETRKNCVDKPRQTNNCTAGHVLSVISTIEDRICIANKGASRFRLSAQDAVSCDDANYNCAGGYVTYALDYGREFGFVREECSPWQGQNTTCPTEPNKCRENKEHYVLQGYCVVQGPDEIKKEILRNGPVIAPMTPYTDFLTYKEGMYMPSEGAFKFNGQQAVKIVGWEKGMQANTWIIENNWGESWGLDGYAKVIAGHKDIGLDFIGIAPRAIPMPFAEWEVESERLQQQYADSEEALAAEKRANDDDDE